MKTISFRNFYKDGDFLQMHNESFNKISHVNQLNAHRP
jgi:hypothetical protein